jgi:O-antigen/teichoic acid export membrane protein/2-polyprenyl-3-methyl-5-hydroxy-6-metoxy-1,4-benzoquinol methylase
MTADAASAATGETPVSAQPSVDAGDVTGRLGLMREGLVNYAGVFVSGVIAIFMIPLLARGLGHELYGFWIAVLGIVSLASAADLGVGWSVSRAVAASGVRPSHALLQFVATAAWFYALSGVAAAGVVAFLVLTLARTMPAADMAAGTPAAVALVAGILFWAGHLTAFSVAVFYGLRRYGFISGLAVFTALAGAAGAALVLRLGGSLVQVASWYCLVSMVAAVSGIIGVLGWAPRLRRHAGRLDLRVLRSELRFSLMSQATTFSINAIWHGTAVLIGGLRGAAAVVPYHVGQKFPLAVSMVSWRAAEVAFPAAGATATETDGRNALNIIRATMRWNLFLVLPLCVTLWVSAPDLITAWFGAPWAEAQTVMRWLLLGVLADALGVGPLHVLWARSDMRAMFATVGTLTILGLAASVLVLAHGGVSSVAVVVAVVLSVRSILLIRQSARLCHATPWMLLNDFCTGLLWPAAALGAVVAAVLHLLGGSWTGLLVGWSAGAVVYSLGVLTGGARTEERLLVGGAVHAFRQALPQARQALWHALRGMQPLRSSWYLGHGLVALVRDPWLRSSAYDQEFERSEDPWEYARPQERERHGAALALVYAARRGRMFGKALEIGCAEGVFTEQLAGACHVLDAVDYSAVALRRASARCSMLPHVRFAKWDLRSSATDGTYELVAAMDVLSSIFRPWTLRAVVDRLVGSVEPGGYLLVGDVRLNDVWEQAWWSRYLLRGAKWIVATCVEHPQLELVDIVTLDSHILALLRRRP